MKKIDPDDVGAALVLIMLFVVIILVIIIEPIILWLIFGIVVVLGFPYVFAHLWNTYIASEDEENDH